MGDQAGAKREAAATTLDQSGRVVADRMMPLLLARFGEMLNELLAVDRAAIEQLFHTRAVANASLLDHPTVQVREGADGYPSTVGFLGLLNGLTSAQGWVLVAVMDDDGRTIREFVLGELRPAAGGGKMPHPVEPPAGTGSAT